jgi:hypothetical protein
LRNNDGQKGMTICAQDIRVDDASSYFAASSSISLTPGFGFRISSADLTVTVGMAPIPKWNLIRNSSAGVLPHRGLGEAHEDN